jgi:cytochrome oxidase Cu insertion factor (SCO1/SenC/PrrC family)
MVPVIDGLYKQYGSGVVFISVSGNWQGATAQDTAKFQQDYGSTWIYVYDGSGAVFSSYGISSTPTFFIIGKNGSVFTTYQGEIGADVLATDLTRAQTS